MQFYYTDTFVLPLPATHRFPMEKYSLLREVVAREQMVAAKDLQIPEPATDDEIRLAHAADYLTRVATGQLSKQEIRRIGFPWSPELVERSRRSSGATIAACRSALQHGLGANLAGGTHHAFHDRGQGYCVFNDSVIAARVMQAEQRVKRVVILDCDVHQGDGTAALTQEDPSIYTFSIHGARNYPAKKETSNLDVPLDDGADDSIYLAALERGVNIAIRESQADLAIYLAGADPYAGDRLGRLAVTKAGLLERDRLVLEACRRAGLPVAVTMAGGYADDVQDIVEIHANTLRTAVRTLAR